MGEVRELVGRVVRLEIRDADRSLIADAEGELGQLEASGRECSFQLGGAEPREQDGIRFEQPSWIGIGLHADRVAGVWDIATGVGVSLVLRVQLVEGITITFWPAMPPGEQFTDRHFQNR